METDVLKESWQTLEEHPIFFGPKLVGLVLSVLWFLIIYGFWNVMSKSIFFAHQLDAARLVVVALYLLIECIIIFVCSRWSFELYEKTLVAKKVAHNPFYHIAGMGLFLYVTLAIPVLAISLLLVVAWLKQVSIVTNSFYYAMLIVWLVFMLFRYFVIVPHMTKTKYHISHVGAHIAKSHFHHTLSAWIFVFTLAFLSAVIGSSLSTGQAVNIWLYALAGVFIIVAEVLVSVWEQVIIFRVFLHKQLKTPQKQHATRKEAQEHKPKRIEKAPVARKKKKK